MKLFIEKITYPSESEVSSLELEYAKSLKSPKRREEFLCGRALLRRIAKSEYGCENIEVKINGKKPELVCSSFYFSISHSRGLIALAVSDKPVGVDIEYIDPKRDTGKIIKRFSLEIQREYEEISESEKKGYFYNLWTSYESCIKLRGETISTREFDMCRDNVLFVTQRKENYALTCASFR